VIDQLTYNDNVVNLVGSVKTDYTVKNNQVAIPAELAENISVGDVYILQSQENPFEYTYHKAEEITTKDGVAYISNTDEELALEDVAQEIKMQGTVVPTAENTVIYDGNGNLISAPQVVSQKTSGGDLTVMPLGITQTGVSNKHTFKVGDYSVTLSYNIDGAIDMKIGVSAKQKVAGGDLKEEASFEISKLEITRDFDYGVFKGLKSAMLKVDYETKSKFGVSYSTKPIDAVAAPKYSNGNGKFLTNFKRSVLKDKDGAGAKTIASKKTIKVCSLNVYNAGVAKICLDVNLKLAVDGSISVTITQGGTAGVEYKNGNLRFIKKNYKSAEAEMKAQVELTLTAGPALYLIGLKKKLLGVDVELGVGASASLKAHLADMEMHLIEELSFKDSTAEDCAVMGQVTIDADAAAIQAVAEAQGGVYKAEAGATVDLHVDVCLDVSVYGILKFGLADESYAKQFLGGKVTLTCTVFSAKNAKFFNYHVDNWNWSGAVMSWGKAANESVCTLKYVPFDTSEEEPTEPETAEATQNDGDIPFGEFIVLSEFRAQIGVNDKYAINIVTIPKGYSLGDLRYETADKNIATVNGQGVVTGVKKGNTTITVKTGDGKYAAVIAIAVLGNDKINFEGIKVL
jgi:hypothetical protein